MSPSLTRRDAMKSGAVGALALATVRRARSEVAPDGAAADSQAPSEWEAIHDAIARLHAYCGLPRPEFSLLPSPDECVRQAHPVRVDVRRQSWRDASQALSLALMRASPVMKAEMQVRLERPMNLRMLDAASESVLPSRCYASWIASLPSLADWTRIAGEFRSAFPNAPAPGGCYATKYYPLAEAWGTLAAAGVWWMSDGARCSISEHPTLFRVNERCQLHSMTGKAAQFRDGWGIWAKFGKVVDAGGTVRTDVPPPCLMPGEEWV